MEIKVMINQNEWNQALTRAVFSAFQQSWEWGEVLLAEGKQVERLAVLENGAVVALAQVVYSDLPFGWKYAYATAGPVVTMNQELGIMNQECDLLCEYLRKRKCIFFRFEPSSLIPNSKFLILKSLDLTPSTTSILDLRKSSDELLAAMHKNTRYSIRQAESKGVTVKQEKNFEIFWLLIQKTGERNNLRLHGRKHYEVILQNKNCVQLNAYKDTVPVATAVFWHCGNTMTYLFAASDYTYHELQAPYLLQKEAIALAQQLGCKKYDFFGIAPKSKNQENNKTIKQDEYDYDRNHKYAGITKFKMGFGGEIASRPGTFDIVLKPVRYRLYNLLRTLRRLV